MIYVVLGMHKSGTTLIAKLLHESGIPMGQFDASGGYDQGNFFERVETRELNGRLLGDHGRQSFDVCTMVERDQVAPAILDVMREVVKKAGEDREAWGFKDPRTCLTYAVWAQVLPQHRIVFLYRHPEEVCGHYIRRLPAWRILSRLHRARKVLRAWHIYNEVSRRQILEARAETRVLSYADLMNSDESLVMLSEFVGQPLQDCRDPKMYRAGRAPNFEYVVARLLCKLVDGADVERLYGDLDALGNGLNA